MPRWPALKERLFSHIDKIKGGCWIWTGGRLPKGYGVVHVTPKPGEAKKSRLAHRVVYELLVGPIPAGLTLDHKCHNRSCVNPKHLEIVSHSENGRRYFASITHCPYGHEYTEDNIYWGTAKKRNGDRCRKRGCRTCALIRAANYRAMRKATKGHHG